MQIKIEKMIYGGDGLGRLAPDEQGRSKTVFVPFVLPGEVADVREVESKPGFSRAELLSIEAASPARKAAECPYFGSCGGCHYQHTSYEEQLKFKASILRETLARGAKLELGVELKIHSASPWKYRNRTRLKIAHEPEFAVGYFRHRSHALMPVHECPISSPLIQRGIAALWELGEIGKVPQEIREVQFFASHDDSAVLVEVYAGRELEGKAFRAFCSALRERMPEVCGVTAFAAGRPSGEEDPTGLEGSGGRGELFTEGDKALTYEVAGKKYRVSAGAFFQTNRFLVEELARTAIADAKGSSAIDLYAGAGLFTLLLTERFGHVTAVEASAHSAADLAINASKNVKVMRATTEEFVRRFGSATADLVVVDPPRAGLGERVAQALGRLHVSRVTYVSCDPATLSRDLKVLLQSGFRVEQAHLVDLFPQTFHMESVFHLVR